MSANDPNANDPNANDPNANDPLANPEKPRPPADAQVHPHEHPHTLVDRAGEFVLPAWRSVTNGEARWPAVVAILAAMAMQFLLPERLALGSSWVIPAVEGALLVALTVIAPARITKQNHRVRVLSLLLIAALTVDNITSAARLIDGVVSGTESSDPTKLLLTGGAIWLVNVIVFALWYWEFDRGGPGARATAKHQYPDFVFPQMQSPDLAEPDWEPAFVDYLYMSFTNATAFSPTDTLPFSRWAKLLMMTQSAVSLVTVALVIARAVNILKT